MPPTTPGRNRHLEALAPAVRSLVQQRIDEHAERQATLDNLVAQVVTDLGDAVEGRCACGCGAPITAASPSAYYASADCQQAWMARHADNPGEVYDRRDAAAYPVIDAETQELSEPGIVNPARLARARGRAAVGSRAVDIPPRAALDSFFEQFGHADHVHVSTTPPVRRQRVYGPGSFTDVLAYRRTCPDCDDFMEPLIFDVHAAGDRALDPEYRIYLCGPTWEQECSSCGTAMVGAVHVPIIYPSQNPAGWTLELHTTYGRVRSTVTALTLARMDSDQARAAYLAETWASMERDLGRFEREWLGRLNRVQMQVSGPLSDEALRIYFGHDVIS